jgi:hypothetical protein
VELELAFQHPSGAFSTGFLGGFTNVYQVLTTGRSSVTGCSMHDRSMTSHGKTVTVVYSIYRVLEYYPHVPAPVHKMCDRATDHPRSESHSGGVLY